MPCLRVSCATATPASPSFRIPTICDSVNRDFFIGPSLQAKSCQKSPVVAVYREGKLTPAPAADVARILARTHLGMAAAERGDLLFKFDRRDCPILSAAGGANINGTGRNRSGGEV